MRRVGIHTSDKGVRLCVCECSREEVAVLVFDGYTLLNSFLTDSTHSSLPCLPGSTHTHTQTVAHAHRRAQTDKINMHPIISETEWDVSDD